MADNLLQKILQGKYTNQELDEIIEHAMVAKQTYKGIDKNYSILPIAEKSYYKESTFFLTLLFLSY